MCIYCYTAATTYIAHMLYLVSILVRDLSDNFYLHLRVESTSLVKPIDSIKTMYYNYVHTLVSEVRKYTLDMNINTKIPEQEFHKLWFYQIRIKFQGLCVHPFNFKILGLSAIFSAIIQSAEYQDFLLFLLLANPWENCWEKTTVETWLRWVNFCLRLWSSELPS